MKQNYLRLKTSFWLFPIYLCLFIFFTGCRQDKPGIPDFKPDSDITPGDISDKLDARIYFDASASMKGYVVPDTTQYKSILRLLESVITSGWRNGKAEFFKFGEQVNPINRDNYLMAGSADFYDEMRTYIQNIFKYEEQLAAEKTEADNTPEDSTEDAEPPNVTNGSIKENSLVIIVTDLFQDRQDVNLLVRQIKEKYIQKGLEVGILGLRSEFYGRVYNLGTAPILYDSILGDPETYRPFYLLVLGRHADIAHYFDRLKKANEFPDAETIIFSQYLVNPLLSFDGATIETENLNRTNYVPEDPRLLQYEIVKNELPAKISAKMEYDPLPHAMFFDANTFEYSVIAEHKPDRNGENKPSPDAKKCLEVKPTFSGNELTIAFDLTASLPRKAVYLYGVTLHPAIDTYKVPDWCSDWDMGAERNGARTLNLVNFVRDLTETTARAHDPKIAQFYFYIGKR